MAVKSHSDDHWATTRKRLALIADYRKLNRAHGGAIDLLQDWRECASLTLERIRSSDNDDD